MWEAWEFAGIWEANLGGGLKRQNIERRTFHERNAFEESERCYRGMPRMTNIISPRGFW